jgi:hypothetical protein
VDKVVGGCVDLARMLTVDPAVLRTSKAAADFLVRRGLPVPSDTAVLYAAVDTDANQRATRVVGVFRSAREARAYADAVGWSDFQVAPYRLHAPWLAPEP